MSYEYAIQASTVDGTPVLIPLGFGSPEISQQLADMYVNPITQVKPGERDSDIDWSTYSVIRRTVGEWEEYHEE